jgi:hypothetical protein
MIEENLATEEGFALDIERIVVKDKVNYIDAIVEYCERNELDVLDVVHLISKPLKEKLESNAMELNIVARQATLPI